MKKRCILKYLSLCFVLFAPTMYGVGDLKVLAVPGQNGLGSEIDYVKRCLGNNKIDVTRVGTPKLRIDFGQNNCMKCLREALSSEKNEDDVIIHATSQGTATVLNYLSTNRRARRRVKALILESVLISGNDAIKHTIKSGLMGPLKGVAKLPLSYYWLPYCAKFMFPFYWPGGKQVIKTLENFPNDIPVIIIHSRGDMQLSHRGALALYHGLRSNGNNNVYLIDPHGDRHIQILSRRPGARKLVRDILARHNVIEQIGKPIDPVDLVNLQPNHNDDRYSNPYDDLNNKERWHTRLWATLVTGGVV
ncbi:hypothetical protein ACFLYU_02240, partial [Candidatus Dependentiae bacterium]